MNIYTSRSAVEAYNNCHRLRYLEYLLYGKGVVGKQRSVPLVSGTTVHRGVEVLLNQARIGNIPDVDHAVKEALKVYDGEVVDAGFSGRSLKDDRQQWFTYCEQKALTEALIRIWHMRELPNILARYKILAAEREIEPLLFGEVDNNGNGSKLLFWQSKVDAEFQEITSSDYHNYSLKTVAMWNERSERSYRSDLQGVTEIWGVEEDHRRSLRIWDIMTESAHELVNRNQGAKNMVHIWDFLGKKKPADKRVMGVRFCFLVKGQWRKEDLSNPDSLKVTESPLIRGYKNITPGGISYAHSWWYPNPSNKSGKGALGKGWERFNLWESDISIKRWLEVLNAQEIQPECGDVIGQHVITPPEYFRDELEIKEAMEEIRYSEERIATTLNEKGEVGKLKDLLAVFPHNRAHCYWHFGDECPYVPICWEPTTASDIMGSGLYQIRIPHHEGERVAIGKRES